MGKKVPVVLMDAYLTSLEGTRIHYCSDEPADYADISNVELAAANVSGSHVKANGDIDGRKTTCPAQTGVPITQTGIADHVALSDGAAELKRVTTCASQSLTSGGTLNSNAFAHTIRSVV